MSYVDLTGNSGSYVSTPDHTSLDVAGTIELIACFNLDSMATNQGIITKLDGGSNSGYRMLVLTSGAIQFAWGNGASTAFKSSSVTPVSVDTDVWIRCTFDGTNWDIDYSYDDPDTPIDSITWTPGTGNTEGTVTSIQANGAAVELGIRDGSFYTNGQIYCARIKDGSTVVGNPDFRDGDQTSDDGATFVDDQGRTWTVQGDASWVDTGPEAGGPTALQVSTEIDYSTQTVTVTESR